MRIALICTEKLPVPSIRGGAIQILIDGILPYLKRDNEITVFCVEDEALPCLEQMSHLKIVRIKREGYPYEVARVISTQTASSQKFDLIHVFNRPRDLLLYKTASVESRFVLSLHNEMFKEGKISYELGNLVIAACDRIITVSEYIKRTIISRFPSAAEKTFAFYSGVEIAKYQRIYDAGIRDRRNLLRSKYGITDKNKVILFVGRLSKVKGVDVLIEAFSKLQSCHPEAFLMIVGSKWFGDDSIDEYGKMLRDRISEKQIRNVVFTGFVPPDGIPDFYLSGDLFVCPSQWQEPLARVHYEAMASGLPIVTTNRGGNSEVIKNNVTGLVIDDYSNPDVLCARIRYLIDNPEIALQMGRNAFETASHKFDYQFVSERIMTYYLQALNIPKQMTDNISEVGNADEVMREYSIVFDKIELLSYKTKKSVFKIHSPSVSYILKKMNIAVKHAERIVCMYEKLFEKKIRIPRLINAYGERKFVEKNSLVYFLFEYVDGEKPDYNNRDDLKKLVGGLAVMHNCCVNDSADLTAEILQKNTKCYLDYMVQLNKLRERYLEESAYLSDYDILCNGFIDTAISQCRKAETFLNRICDGKIDLVICHGDYVSGNTCITSNRELYIFDIDSADWDFAPRDIRRLCNKIMKKLENGWTLDVFLEIYHDYVSVRNLSSHEKIYLMMELWYPHLFLEQIKNYYRNTEPEWTSDKYLKKLKMTVKIEASKENVLNEFARILGIE